MVCKGCADRSRDKLPPQSSNQSVATHPTHAHRSSSEWFGDHDASYDAHTSRVSVYSTRMHACGGVSAMSAAPVDFCWLTLSTAPKDVRATSTWLISTGYRFSMCASGVLEARAQTGNMQSMIAEIAHVSTLLRWCHCVRFTSRDTKIGKSFLLLVASLNLLRPTKPSPNTKCATAYGRSVTIPARRQGSTVRPFPPHLGHLGTFYNKNANSNANADQPTDLMSEL